MIHNPIARRRFPSDGWTDGIQKREIIFTILWSLLLVPTHRSPPDSQIKYHVAKSIPKNIPIPMASYPRHPPFFLSSSSFNQDGLIVGFSTPPIRFRAIHKEGHARLTGLTRDGSAAWAMASYAKCIRGCADVNGHSWCYICANVTLNICMYMNIYIYIYVWI